MMSSISKYIVFILVGVFCLTGSKPLVAQESPALLKAKKDAEAKGYTFIASRDEIIAEAKKEGQVRVLSAMNSSTFPPMVKAFKHKYPFLDLYMEEITGSDSAQRFLLELQAGMTGNWDVFRISTDFYDKLAVHAKKIDLLGMAEHGVLQIPRKMIDARYRDIIHGGSAIASAAYNKELISAEQVPDTWEDFLKPEFKGRKFLVDIRPLNFAPFGATLGEEWLLNYARRIKEQQPIWVRGHARGITAIVGGEYALYQLTNYHTCMRAQRRDPKRVLVCKLVEPVPVRLSVQQGIIKNAPRPYSAILFLEFLASPEVQKILDDEEPLKSSIYAPDSELEKVTRGRKVAVMDTFEHTDRWVKKTVEAFGFPRAERLKGKK